METERADVARPDLALQPDPEQAAVLAPEELRCLAAVPAGGVHPQLLVQLERHPGTDRRVGDDLQLRVG